MVSVSLSREQRDENLVRHLAEGAEEPLQTLLDRHWASAYRVAHRLTGDAVTAEDVAQETFVKVLRAAGTFDHARPFGPWFYRILRNEAYSANRTRQRRSAHEARAEPVRAGGQDAVAQREAVDVYLSRLPDAQREPIALHYLGGLTFQEVADTLGWPKGTVTSRIRRGMRSLQSSVQAFGVNVGALVPLFADLPASDAPLAWDLIQAGRGPALPETVPPPPAASSLAASAARGRHWAGALAALAVVAVAAGGYGLSVEVGPAGVADPAEAPQAQRASGDSPPGREVGPGVGEAGPADSSEGLAPDVQAAGAASPAGDPNAGGRDAEATVAVATDARISVRVVDDQGQAVSNAQLVMSYDTEGGERDAPGQVFCDALGRAEFRLERDKKFAIHPVKAGHGVLQGFDTELYPHQADGDLDLEFVLTRLAHVQLVVDAADVQAGDLVEVATLYANWPGGEPEPFGPEFSRRAVCAGRCGSRSPGCSSGGELDQFTTPAPNGDDDDAPLSARTTYACRLGPQAQIVVPVFPGQVTVSLSLAGGRQTTPVRLELSPAEQRTCRVGLVAGHPFAGAVRDPNGAPVPGATITFSGHGAHPLTTDAEGRFATSAPKDEVRDLTIAASGFSPQTVERVSTRGRLDVVLEPVAYVRLERARLTGVGAIEWYQHSEGSRRSGMVAIKDWPTTVPLRPGRVDLKVSWEAGKPATRHVLELEPGQTTTLHEVDSRREDTLGTLRVIGPDPGGGSEVSLSIQGTDPGAPTAERGLHRRVGTIEKRKSLPADVAWWPGPWIVVVVWGNGLRSTHRFTLVSGETTTLRFDPSTAKPEH